MTTAAQNSRVLLPEAPILAAGLSAAVWITPDGEVAHLDPKAAARKAQKAPPLLCHGRATARRLGLDPFPAFDLLELYAFVRPAAFRSSLPAANSASRARAASRRLAAAASRSSGSANPSASARPRGVGVQKAAGRTKA